MIVRVSGVCILGCIMCIFLRRSGRDEMALLTALAITVYVLFMTFSEVFGIVATLREMAESTGLDFGIYKTVIKITGIAYVTQSASELCKDSGEGALSGKVELFGKVIICASALPAVKALIKVISDMI